MSVRRADNFRPDAPAPIDPPEATAAPKAPGRISRSSADTAPAPVIAPRSTEEAEERYVTARDAWIAAMRKANSGRSADLASLAFTQQAYEQAAAEVERWRSGAMVAIKVEPEAKLHDLEAAIGQEMAWRRVHENQEKRPGPLAQALRRLTRRG